MDYELANQTSTDKTIPSASQMHVLLADLSSRPIQEVRTLLSELSIASSLWNWLLIEKNAYAEIVQCAAPHFAISTITIDKKFLSRFDYPKLVKRIIAQEGTTNKAKLILLIIDDQQQRSALKSRFIRIASRQLRQRFIDLRLSKQCHSSNELTQLQSACIIFISDNCETSALTTNLTNAYTSKLKSLSTLLSLIINIRNAMASKKNSFLQTDDEKYFDAIFDELSDHTQSDMRVYKETHVARAEKNIAESHSIHTARELLAQLNTYASVKDDFIQQLTLTPTLPIEQVSLLRKSLVQAAPQLKLWAKGNAGELRVWVPNFRNYPLVKEIAVQIRSVLNEIDEGIILKLFASDNDVSRIRIAQCEKSVEKPMVGSNIILSHHDLLRQAPFYNIHILFLFKFMSHLGLNHANRLYSMYHFAMVSGGLLISDESLTEEASRYFSKPSAQAKHFINHKKSKRIQYPKLSTIQRRPVKMALAPQSVKKITSVLDKHYQTALLNKMLTLRNEALLVINKMLEVTHFYGIPDHFINPYSAGQFCYSLDRLLGNEYSNKIKEHLQSFDENNTPSITISPSNITENPDFIVELCQLSLTSEEFSQSLTSAEDLSNLYSIRLKPSKVLNEPQLAYNRFLVDKIKRLETRVEAINQKYTAHTQCLGIAKKQLSLVHEKSTLITDENNQIRNQFRDVENELVKLNTNHKLLATSLKEDSDLKKQLLKSSNTGVIICNLAENNFYALGYLSPFLSDIDGSHKIENLLSSRLPSVLNAIKLSAIDGEARTKNIFIYGQLIRFSITPMACITQQVSNKQLLADTQSPYRVAIIFKDVQHR